MQVRSLHGTSVPSSLIKVLFSVCKSERARISDEEHFGFIFDNKMFKCFRALLPVV